MKPIPGKRENPNRTKALTENKLFNTTTYQPSKAEAPPLYSTLS